MFSHTKGEKCIQHHGGKTQIIMEAIAEHDYL